MPPPAAPGAPATYTFGVDLTSAQQALVRRGLDAGARLYRSALGRELPPFAVWAYTNLEELIRAYASNSPTSPEDARACGREARRATSITNVRAQWIRSAKASAATLNTLATLRGQRETAGAYDIYALATERLLSDRDPKLTFAYYEAVARGVSWPEAFATTFGRTFEAFVAEFEAYRQTV